MGHEKTQYGGDVVMFLPNKIIKNKNLNYPKKMLAVHMVLKPCARPSKLPMVLLYMVYGFKTMCKANIFYYFVK